MKGLILSGGHGTRLRPLTYSQQKQLIPISNKPILFYTIEDLIEAGVKDIGIIIGPNKEQVIEAVKKANFKAKITFIEQDAPRGLAHAVLISEDFIGNDPFVMYLGDNLLRNGIISYSKEFLKGNMDASILLTEYENPTMFGCAELNSDGTVKRLIEKPKNPPSNLILVGVYFFRPSIFEAVKKIKPSWRGELEITDAIQYLIDKKYNVHSQIVKGWWKDTGKTEDILEANRLILEDMPMKVEENIKCKIIGKAIVGKDAQIDEKSLIKGPVIIGKNCIIKKSQIGPFTSIGDGCKIINSNIEDSIVMENTSVINSGKIIESLIGRDVKIERNVKIPKGITFIIGDNSEVKI